MLLRQLTANSLKKIRNEVISRRMQTTLFDGTCLKLCLIVLFAIICHRIYNRNERELDLDQNVPMSSENDDDYDDIYDSEHRLQ